LQAAKMAGAKLINAAAIQRPAPWPGATSQTFRRRGALADNPLNLRFDLMFMAMGRRSGWLCGLAMACAGAGCDLMAPGATDGGALAPDGGAAAAAPADAAGATADAAPTGDWPLVRTTVLVAAPPPTVSLLADDRSI
jgi:hypothetical protein